MALSVPTDGAPPSPATDPAAAQEAGAPASAIQGLIGGQNPMMPAGPDLSGIMTLGEKLEQGLLTLAQAVPLIAPDMDQARSILMNALGKFASSTVGGTGTSPSMPMAGPAPGGPGAPTGMAVTQAGAQFPGAMGGGKPF